MVTFEKAVADDDGDVGPDTERRLISESIGDRYADRQLEVEIEADLVTETSQAALAVYEQAQNANHAAPEKREEMRDAAADTWAQTTDGSLTPRFMSYYGKDAEVMKNWYTYKEAVYKWAVLGCCTDKPREEDVAIIRSYVEAQDDPGPALPAEDWATLTVKTHPPKEVYQRVGLALLRGRGRLLTDLRTTRAQLD